MRDSAYSLREQLQSAFVWITMVLALVAAYLIYTYILGDPSHFVDQDPANQPLSGDYLGTVYKGGYAVVILLSLQIILITFILERLISLQQASGRGSSRQWLQQLKQKLAYHDLEGGIQSCDQQGGSLGNVVRNGLSAYQRMQEESHLEEGERVQTLQRELDESTHLEMPVLQRNMAIISTIASIATLIGLLGTVLGMIKAFAALARVGAPDAVALANGISQALVTTALGISTAAVAIIFYNYLTSRIDRLIFDIDEATYALVQSFKTRHASTATA